MSKLPIAAALFAAVMASPALASDLPSSRDVEDMAPALDRMVGVLMNMDVGPLMDAADPLARDPWHGAPGRTLGAMGRARDPHFDQRVRGAIYGGTAQAGRMMDAFSAMLPALQRSMGEMQRGMSDAMRAYRDPSYAPDDEAPYPGDEDDGFFPDDD